MTRIFLCVILIFNILVANVLTIFANKDKKENLISTVSFVNSVLLILTER